MKGDEDQPELFAGLGASGVEDAGGLERFYTPDALAVAVVREVAGAAHFRAGLDPHVGGGAFARAMELVCAEVYGVDIDPDAVGLRHVGGGVYDWRHVGTGEWGQVELVAGNPPFSTANEHVAATFRACPTAIVAFVLPLSNLGLLSWQPLFNAPSHHMTRVLVILRRPWACVREVAVFVWWPRYEGAMTGGQPTVKFLSW